MKFLAAIRKKMGLTQQNLAEMVGVGTNTIARYERGEMVPSAKIARDIATALNSSESELLNGPKQEGLKINILMEVEDMMNEMAIKKDEFNVGFRSDGQFIFWGALPQDMSIDAILDKFRVELTLAHEMKDLRDKKLKDN